jgi:hypothetical protein
LIALRTFWGFFECVVIGHFFLFLLSTLWLRHSKSQND